MHKKIATKNYDSGLEKKSKNAKNNLSLECKTCVSTGIIHSGDKNIQIFVNFLFICNLFNRVEKKQVWVLFIIYFKCHLQLWISVILKNKY